MKFILGNSYRIVFDVKGKALTFQCIIEEDDENFITFIDKYGKKLTYNKNIIISVEEIK